MQNCFWNVFDKPASQQIHIETRRALTHQADEDEDELYDVCVSHRVETSQQSICDGNSGRDPDAHRVGQIQDHTHGNTCSIKKKTWQFKYTVSRLTHSFQISWSMYYDILVIKTIYDDRHISYQTKSGWIHMIHFYPFILL